MAAEEAPTIPSGIPVDPDRPLIGIVLFENGEEVVHYFLDEADADAAAAADRTPRERVLAGAWRDFDWDETVEELDRIRHENTPTPGDVDI